MTDLAVADMHLSAREKFLGLKAAAVAHTYRWNAISSVWRPDE